MKVAETSLPEVLLIEPEVFGDSRGFFYETYKLERYAEFGIGGPFVQDNLSYSEQGVLRGLHLQNPKAQGKLVYVLQGEVFDVAVDVRIDSPTFGRWAASVLSDENRRQFYIPEGFAHGFCVISGSALLAYKCTEQYFPDGEITVAWNDPGIDIDWPIDRPKLSSKDEQGLLLREIDPARLPGYRKGG
jgi:dTDP-4-dehydrorhamnose 3,5-epimerase